MKERIDYLDIAKAICIVLVVVGHFNPVPAPDGWSTVVKVIYSFHMPLFMFVSGLLSAKTYSPQPYGCFIWKKFRHLMIPYLLTSLFIIGTKLATQSILPVKNTASPADFISMFWKPSAAVHLWFLWALMLIFLIVPLCRSRISKVCFLVATAALWLLPVEMPDIFALPQFKANAVFFAAGMLTGSFTIEPYLTRPYNIMLALLFAVMEVMLVKGIALPLLRIVIPFTGIIFILTISHYLDVTMHGKARQALLFVGQSSFIIFLLHTAFGEAAKAALSFAGITASNHFCITLLLFVLAGTAAPLLLKVLWRNTIQKKIK